MAMAADLALGDDTEPTDLALRLDYQPHILVDEFEDTSLTQFSYWAMSRLVEHNFVNPNRLDAVYCRRCNASITVFAMQTGLF